MKLPRFGLRSWSKHDELPGPKDDACRSPDPLTHGDAFARAPAYAKLMATHKCSGQGGALMPAAPCRSELAPSTSLTPASQQATQRPESGVTLALWFAKLAEDLGPAPGTVSPFRRELTPGMPFSPEALRAAFGLPDGMELSVRSADDFFAAYPSRAALPPRGQSVRELMNEHLSEVRLVEVGAGLSAVHKLLVGGRATDGSFAGFVVRLGAKK